MIKLREVNEGTIYGVGEKFEIRKENIVQKPWHEGTVIRK